MLQSYPEHSGSGARTNGEQDGIFRRNNEVDELSERQRQVTRLACVGLSNKDIARRLEVTEGTVKIHLKAAYRTLGVTSRTGLLGAIGVPQVTACDMDVGPADHGLLNLLAEGTRNDDIADHLGVTPEYVKSRVRALTIALGVSNRTQLAAWWLVKEGRALPDMVGNSLAEWSDPGRLDTLRALVKSGVGIGILRNAMTTGITDIAEGLLLLLREHL